MIFSLRIILMALLPPIEIESELSYAYLHAVAANSGMSCESNGRHADNMGIDATIRVAERFSINSLLTDFSIEVQLKATIANAESREGRIPYVLKGIERYDKLRKTTVNPPKILVVLFLPREQSDWINVTTDHLLVRKCAWWVSLRGAPESNNTASVTVYLPEDQHYNSNNLRTLMARLSMGEELNYGG
jgi:hypothetical protein